MTLQEGKNTLKLEDIAIYLPYKVRLMHGGVDGENKVMNTGQGSSTNWVGIGSVIKWQERPALKCFLLLRELSLESLKKEYFFEDSLEFTIPYDYLGLEKYLSMDLLTKKDYWVELLPYHVVSRLIEWHFDINGLIDRGHAIKIED